MRAVSAHRNVSLWYYGALALKLLKEREKPITLYPTVTKGRRGGSEDFGDDGFGVK